MHLAAINHLARLYTYIYALAHLYIYIYMPTYADVCIRI